MKEQFLECGRVVSVHGLRGDVRAQSWGDSPEELCEFDTLYLDKGARALTVEKARLQKNLVLLKVAGVDTAEQAQALRGKILYINRAQETLAEGQYYIQDLLGLRVVDADDGQCYGTLCDITETGANDVYHIRFEDGSVKLIPAIPQVVLRIDLADETMTIRPLKGLFDHEPAI